MNTKYKSALTAMANSSLPTAKSASIQLTNAISIGDDNKAQSVVTGFFNYISNLKQLNAEKITKSMG